MQRSLIYPVFYGSESDNISVDYKNKYAQQQQIIKNNYATFDVPYNGKDNNNYADGEGFCCDDKPEGSATTRSLNPGQNDSPEKFQFYYHPDHLGSSSYITNLDGNVVQHIEYVPFGEVFVEERNNKWNTPYLFNAKELDEETGLYYYGARYYNPRISLWLSTDPLQEKYPNISSYVYCVNNPVRYIDPTGKFPIETIWDIGNVIYDIGAAVVNHIKGDHEAAKSNWVDLGLDAGAMLIPYVPAGASKIVKGGAAGVKALDKATDVKKVLTKADDVADVSRKGAFNQAKKDPGIPKSQQPDKINGKQYDMVPMTDKNGKTILGKDGKPVMTREYHYTKQDGSKTIIQDHSAGHPQYAGDAAKPHLNVRPPENTRTGKVSGIQNHYPFKNN